MKYLSIPLILIALLISCTPQPAAEVGAGYVTLSRLDEKKLDVMDAGGISKYRYTATPLFSLTGTPIQGRTNTWTDISANSGSSEIIGPFTQGKWQFGLRAYNMVEGEEHVLWEGENNGYIGDSTLSVIEIPMHRVNGKGNVKFEITVPRYADSMSDPSITIDDKNYTVTWQKVDDETGSVIYTGQINDLSIGWHPVSVRMVTGNTEAGTATVVEIAPGLTVTIKGSFESGKYHEPHFKIDEPLPSRAEIRIGSTAVSSVEMEVGENRTLTCALTSGRKDATVTWFVNGAKTATGASFKFAPEANGTYEITALTRHWAKSTIGNTYIEESTSASILVLVHPEMSTIFWDNGTTITEQTLPYDTVIKIGQPYHEGKVFSHWKVTEGYTGNVLSGTEFTFNKPLYRFTAVWSSQPRFHLALKSANVLEAEADSVITVPSVGLVGKIDSKIGQYPADSFAARWYFDGQEVFWVHDRGGGNYFIPSAGELRMTPGRHSLSVRIDCGKQKAVYDTIMEWK